MSASSVPANWTSTVVGDVATVIRGVTYKKDQTRVEPGDGYLPLLRSGNVQSELSFDGLVYIPADLVKPQQRLAAGDIVVSTSNSRELVGKAAPLRADWEGTFGAF